MRLGGYVTPGWEGPEQWAREARRLGYRAAPCPIDHKADESTVAAFRAAAAQADIVIAEVGAWGNPVSPDKEVSERAISFAQRQLELADRIGARVCVNISGSRSEQWDGPHADNFSEDTFALIVDTVRTIIDAVRPTRTFYALEMMPWALPDGADSYVRLLQAIDRPQMAVHFDPVNVISSPRALYGSGDLIRDFVAKLGSRIRNVHAKDIDIGSKLTVHLSEVIPGKGQLDYPAFLTELNRLDPDLPLIVEHLQTEEQFSEACGYIRALAERMNIDV